MISRLWYPQFDVFDTARRISILLQNFESPPGTERLYIVDFYLANPPLLHHTSMPAGVRKIFSELKIPKPEKTFISYPSAPLLFHKMESIQKEAFNALLGKGLISQEKLKLGYVELTNEGKNVFPINSMCTETEAKISYFLATNFAKDEETGNYDLRRRTGLRRSI